MILSIRFRNYFRLDGIDTQRMSLVLSYKSASISVDFSLLNQLDVLQGEIYEIYGTIEQLNSGKDRYCSALIINIVEGADMKLIEQCLLTFNKSTHPEFQNIFI